MNINNIIISENFTNSKPAMWKLERAKEEYSNGNANKKILIDTNNVLIDGYTRYLAAKELGVKDVEVRIKGSFWYERPTVYVFGKHYHNGKEYVWRLVGNPYKDGTSANRINIGSKVLVDTRYGERIITVTNIKILDKPPVQYKVRKVRRVLL